MIKIVIAAAAITEISVQTLIPIISFVLRFIVIGS